MSKYIRELNDKVELYNLNDEAILELSRKADEEINLLMRGKLNEQNKKANK